jgi:bifunctional non-homologous end joining protein LigD
MWCSPGRGGKTSQPPKCIKPQLTRLVDEPPVGNDWLHEIKYDSYRMHAGRLDHGKVVLLMRTGLDWSLRYRGANENGRRIYLAQDPTALAS